MSQDINTLDIPKGETQDEYARKMAAKLVTMIFTPEQLVGTQLEGLHTRSDGPPPPAAEELPSLEELPPDVAKAIQDGRLAIAKNPANRAIVEQRLRDAGVPIEYLGTSGGAE